MVIFCGGGAWGVCGVALYARSEPQDVQIGLGIEEFDREGRTIVAEFKEFVVLNGYFPNGANDERLVYKMAYKEAFLEACVKWREKTGKPVVFCGDLNTAHRAIDVARPKTKKNKSGFLEEERNWIDEVLEAGFVDSFRYMNPNLGEVFSCWPYSRNSRLRNIGWRLDYIFVDEVWRERIVSAEVETAVYGSDHCPITLELKWE